MPDLKILKLSSTKSREIYDGKVPAVVNEASAEGIELHLEAEQVRVTNLRDTSVVSTKKFEAARDVDSASSASLTIKTNASQASRPPAIQDDEQESTIESKLSDPAPKVYVESTPSAEAARANKTLSNVSSASEQMMSGLFGSILEKKADDHIHLKSHFAVGLGIFGEFGSDTGDQLLGGSAVDSLDLANIYSAETAAFDFSQITLDNLDASVEVAGTVISTEIQTGDLADILRYLMERFSTYELHVNDGNVLVEQDGMSGVTSENVGIWTNEMEDGSQISFVGMSDIVSEMEIYAA